MVNPSKLARHGAFTLMELMVVISVIAILAAISLPLYQRVFKQSHQAIALSNMRQVGIAFLSYAGDHDYVIPGRVKGNDENNVPVPKWPHVLQAYVQDLRVYGAPLDDVGGDTYKVTNLQDYISDTANNTAFIGNGYNDLGALSDADVEIRINRIDHPAETILLGTPFPKKNNYYMDFEEGNPPNNKNVLNVHAFDNGANYFFTDGSGRFLTCDNNTQLAAMQKAPANGGVYSDWLWLVDKSQSSVIH